VVIASDDARFGLPEVKVGLLPLIVMAPILRAAGLKRGLPLVLSGEPIAAVQALEIGLVSRVVPRADLQRETTALARRVASWSPAAVALAKEAAHTIQDMEYTKALRYLREMTTLVALSEDAQEGIEAFFAKRPPQWKGR
jgi:enoyl-CoA hydratase/carnithine racemase